MKTEHIGFYANNMKDTVEFYQKLGFSEHFTLMDAKGNPWITYMKSDTDYFFLELSHTQQPVSFPQNKIRHICFEVDDIAVVADRFQRQVLQSDSNSFFLEDPDGNKIEIRQHADES